MDQVEFTKLLNQLDDVYAAETVPAYIERVNGLLDRIVRPEQISWVFLDPRAHRFHASSVYEVNSTSPSSHHQVIRPGGWSFRVLEQHKPCYHPNTRTAPNINPGVVQAGVRTYAGFPVFANQSPVATVFVNRFETDAYSAEDQSRIATVINECSPRFIQLSSGACSHRTDTTPLVMHVDDNTMIRRMCEVLLKRHELPVIGAASRNEAAQRLLTHTPDVIVLDYDLGQGTGFDVWHTVLSHCQSTGRMPPAAILYSSLTDRNLQTQAKALGFYAALRKGENPINVLLKTIRSAHHWYASAMDFCQAS